jgi:hypothetical protein
MRKQVLRLARRIGRAGGCSMIYYIGDNGIEAARGPYDATAQGRLAAARAFVQAPAPGWAILVAGDQEVAWSGATRP